MPGPVLSRKCPPAIYRRAAYMRPLLRGKTLRFHIRFFQQHFCGQKHHRQPARTRQQKRQHIPGQHVGAVVGVHAPAASGRATAGHSPLLPISIPAMPPTSPKKNRHRKAADQHGQQKLHRRHSQPAENAAHQIENDAHRRPIAEPGKQPPARHVQHKRQNIA